ncbi:MAG: 16S rRNA (cytosine(1402)-N(4))-methyltransferase RsmH [Chloroflexi bacterium]|nr:MAG: 16S rRNA (cytosine(1402)-N(4))-methyltransferase RsmH [Chloroflexota bacterium]
MTSRSSNSRTPRHEPVMLREAVEALAVKPGGRYVDATIGLGGHSRAILEAAPDVRLLGIDQDPQALEAARERLAPFAGAAQLVHGNFEAIADICEAHDFVPVDGVLFDLGVSSLQLDTPGRGFSFQRDEPLDMRMNPDAEVTAADIVNSYDEQRLAALIWEYGEERRSRQIARAIVERRPLHTTGALVNAIEQAVGRGRGRQINPATLTFQALRIAVNRELDILADSLSAAHGLLAGVGSRLVVISFHSLEDRVVKQYMLKESSACLCPPRTPMCVCGHVATLRLVARGALRPGPDEVGRNPRARSARLRVAESITATVTGRAA